MYQINLREIQIPSVERIIHTFTHKRLVLFVSPTGSGKTIMTLYIIKDFLNKNPGKKILYVMGGVDLKYQILGECNKYGITSTLGGDKTYNPYAQCVITNAEKLIKSLDDIDTNEYGLVIFDEAHHTPCPTWSKIHSKFDKQKILGLTATPYRLDNREFFMYFKTLIAGPSITELINEGYLSKYELYGPNQLISQYRDIQVLNKNSISKREIYNIVNRKEIFGDMVSSYKEHCDGKQGIIYCVSLKHAQRIAQEFTENGVSCIEYHGKIAEKKRTKILDDFKHGRIKLLTVVSLLGEGIDISGINVIFMAAPWSSIVDYLQAIGRGLRKDGDNILKIFDLVGNCLLHGSPEDDHTDIFTLKRKNDINIIKPMSKKQRIIAAYEDEITKISTMDPDKLKEFAYKNNKQIILNEEDRALFIKSYTRYVKEKIDKLQEANKRTCIECGRKHAYSLKSCPGCKTEVNRKHVPRKYVNVVSNVVRYY